MKIFKRILIGLFAVLDSLCVAACILLMVEYSDLSDQYETVTEKNRQNILQIADYESEISSLNDRIEELNTKIQKLSETEALEETKLKETESEKTETEEAETETEAQTKQEAEAGTVLPASVAADWERYFTIHEIQLEDEIYQRIIGKSYRENSNVALEDLRYLKLLHYNFQHEIQVGEMIVNVGIAEDVIHIFEELFANEYEIQSIYLIDNFWTGDADSSDTASIEHNNTSCFNYREVTGGGKLSNHAYGRAIDINPQQNPYVWYNGDGDLNWTHSNADPYIDRNSGNAHMILVNDVCYSIFSKYGFSWGGNWENPVDYQHFEKRID